MRINNLKLKNFGPHKELDVVFEAGSTGIFGRNGCGKSTLVDAMYAALTGDFNRFDGTKTDCIRLGCDDKEQSFVEVGVTHNEIDFTLRRSLRPQKNTLVYNGKLVTDSREISDFMDSHGLSKQLLDFAVFKRQNGVFDFLESTPAVRAKAYHSLNKTGNCEKIHDVLRKRIVALQPIAACFDESDDRQKEYLQARQDISANDTRQEDLSQTLVTQEHLQVARKAIEDAKQVVRITQEIQGIDDSLETLTKTTAVEAELQRASSRLTEQEKVVASTEKTHNTSQSRLAVLESHKASARKLWACRSDISTLSRTLPAPSIPPEDGYSPSVNRLNQELSDAKADLVVKEAVVKKFAKTGSTLVCPTCGQETRTLAALYQDSLRDTDRAKETLAFVKADYDVLAEKGRKYQQWAEAEATRSRKLEIAETLLASLQDIGEVDEYEVSELETQLTRLPREKQTLETCRNKFQQLTLELGNLSARIDEMTKSRDRKVETLSGLTRTPEDKLAKIVKRLEVHEKTKVEIATLVAVRAVLVRQMNEAKGRYEQALTQVQRSKTAQQLIDRLTRVQAVFHRDVLPRRVAEVNMIRMEQDLNANLDLFGSPFRVRTAENLTFIVTPPDDLPRPAERLSGGQKTVLAIAFWLAVSKLFGQDVGLLVLDEPTANLDENNVRGLAVAMTAFTASLRGSRQLFMVTHSESLRPAFDSSIVLGNPL